MTSLGVQLPSYMNTIKSIVTSQDFGVEYELLCTQLAIQWTRFRLWGESMGLLMDHTCHLRSRQDINSTLTQTVKSIEFILADIETLRRKYEFNPDLVAEKSEDEKGHIQSSLDKMPASLRKRMSINQRQKSFLTISKWALRDAKKFRTAVDRLKYFIDGLDDISKSTGTTRSRQSQLLPAASTIPEENPPPYSTRSSRCPPAFVDEQLLAQQYASLKSFLAMPNEYEHVLSQRARPKLLQLSDIQFHELVADVYDELIRRQHYASTQSLESSAAYDSARNRARAKLSTVPSHRFVHLINDTFHELKRRHPFLEQQAAKLPRTRLIDTRRYGWILSPTSPFPPLGLRFRPFRSSTSSPNPLRGPSTNHSIKISRPITTCSSIDPLSTGNDIELSSFSSATETSTPEPQDLRAKPTKRRPFSLAAASELAMQRMRTQRSHPYQKTHSSQENLGTSQTSSRPSSEPIPAQYATQLAAESSRRNSWRVKMDDLTWKVLPAACKQYNITIPWHNYCLYITYDGVERRMGLEERPLPLFKQLESEGKTPSFMLRKQSPKEADAMEKEIAQIYAKATPF